MAERVYRDTDGRECDLATMCRREPEWAANRIAALSRSTRLRVTTVWYEQPTARSIELGRAAVRIVTDAGHFHRDVPLSAEGLADARSVAKLCGVDLVIALDLRDAVAGWGGEHA